MINNIQKVVAVLNNFENAEAVLQKTFLIAKAQGAEVEVIYVHEVPLFALPDYFIVQEKRGQDTLDKAQVRQEIRRRIVALEYEQKCTLFTYISDTVSRVTHCVKDATDTLIVTAYHDSIGQSLLKNLSQPILFVKSTKSHYHDIVLNVTLDSQSLPCIEASKALFPKVALELLYNYRYVVDPSMELDIQNLAIIEESQRKSFERVKKQSGLKGTFFVDGTFEGEDIQRYLHAQVCDLVIVCARRSDFFGMNPLVLDLLENTTIKADVLVQGDAEDATQHKLEEIKNALLQTDTIEADEKALAVQKIEDWYIEDKGMQLLEEQLMQISKNIRPILQEIGL